MDLARAPQAQAVLVAIALVAAACTDTFDTRPERELVFPDGSSASDTWGRSDTADTWDVPPWDTWTPDTGRDTGDVPPDTVWDTSDTRPDTGWDTSDTRLDTSDVPPDTLADTWDVPPDTSWDSGQDTADSWPDTGADADVVEWCRFDSDCPATYCSLMTGLCADPTCVDGLWNPMTESDVDCGELCIPCDLGQQCFVDWDCWSGVCSIDGLCVASLCENKQQDAFETGVDCGGPCPPCGPGIGCTVDSDCSSHTCIAGVCAIPRCGDGRRNGNETDVDCGGPQCAACSEGRLCQQARDCTTGLCIAGRCAQPSCTDRLLNGGETDIDCGGPTCAPCLAGQRCVGNQDCESLVCTAGVCEQVSCWDGLVNGYETDVDCGGPVCQPCFDGLACVAHADCASGYCEAGLCGTPRSCRDLLAAGMSTGDGDYVVDPDGSPGPLAPITVFCDMTTDGGGWTEVTASLAHNNLKGNLYAVVPAVQAGVDAQGRPYTRDADAKHTYHYTFVVPGGFTEFMLINYTARANSGPGNTSEIEPQQTFWTDASTGTYQGDISFGTADMSGPVTSFGRFTRIECDTCVIGWPDAGGVYALPAPSNLFRIGWGEQGPQAEGWYPWWSGTIWFR